MANTFNPLDYLGVKSSTPPNLIVRAHAPTNNDTKNVNIGDIWINRDITLGVDKEVYQLIDLSGNTANWAQLYPTDADASHFQCDTGIATVANNTINIFGEGEVTTDGAGNTITVGLTLGSDGQLLTGSTGFPPVWANLTSLGGTVTITNSPGSINLEAVGGGGGANSLTTDDTNAAIAVAGNINILGLPGGNIVTSSAPLAGDNLWIALNNNVVINNLTLQAQTGGVLQTNVVGVVSATHGTDGQLLISATGGVPTWANITAGAGIGIANAGNSITISATGGGGGMPIGSIVRFDLGGVAAKLPVGWLYCDGSSVLQGTYPGLFGVIDHYYLTQDTVRTFDIVNQDDYILCSAYGAGLWVAFRSTSDTGWNSLYATSPDAVNWTQRTWIAAPGFVPKSLVFGDGKFIIVGEEGYIYSSVDGINWVERDGSVVGTNNINKVAHNGLAGVNSKFVAVCDNGRIAYSVDGITWNLVPVSTFVVQNITNVAYGNGLWTAVSILPLSYATSPDGITWTQRQSPLHPYAATHIIYGNGVWIAAGNQNGYLSNSKLWIASSVNGIAWTDITPIYNTNTVNRVTYSPTVTYLTFADSLFVMGSKSYDSILPGQSLWTSYNGLTWTNQARVPNEDFLSQYQNAFDQTQIRTISFGNNTWYVGSQRSNSGQAKTSMTFQTINLTTHFRLPYLPLAMGEPNQYGSIYGRTSEQTFIKSHAYIVEHTPGYIIRAY